MQRLGPETWPFCSASETQQPFCCCQRGRSAKAGSAQGRPQVGRGLLETGGSGTGSRLEQQGRAQSPGAIRAVVGTGTRWLRSCGINQLAASVPRGACGPVGPGLGTLGEKQGAPKVLTFKICQIPSVGREGSRWWRCQGEKLKGQRRYGHICACM